MAFQMNKLFTHRLYFLFDLALLTFFASLYNTPVFSFQHYEIRLVLYGVGLCYLAFVGSQSSLTRTQLGLSTSGTRRAIKDMAVPGGALILAILLSRWLRPEWFRLGISNTWSSIPVRLFTYALFSVPMQELAFRGYVISRLEQFTMRPGIIITASALIFSFIHWPFGSLMMSAGTFVLGIVFARNFLRHRDLITVMTAHWVIGAVLLLCMI